MSIFIEFDTHANQYGSRHWSVIPTGRPNELVATYTGVLIVNFGSGVASGGWRRDRLTFTVPLDGLPPAVAGGHSALRLRNWTVFVAPAAMAGAPMRGMAVDAFGLQTQGNPPVADFDAYVYCDLAVQDRDGGIMFRIAYSVQLIGERFDSHSGKL